MNCLGGVLRHWSALCCGKLDASIHFWSVLSLIHNCNQALSAALQFQIVESLSIDNYTYEVWSAHAFQHVLMRLNQSALLWVWIHRQANHRLPVLVPSWHRNQSPLLFDPCPHHRFLLFAPWASSCRDWVIPRCQIDFWTYFDHPVSAPRWPLLVHAKKIFHVNSRYWDTQHQFNTCWFSSFRSVKFGFYRVALLKGDLLYFRMQNLVCGHKSLWLQREDYQRTSKPTLNLWLGSWFVQTQQQCELLE